VDSGGAELATPSSDPVLSRVYGWNQGLARRDLAALDQLYAEDMCFYGKRMRKAAVLASKERALASDGSFQQQIVGPIQVVPIVSGESAIATFVKRSGDPGHLRDVRARLLLKNFAIDFGNPDAPWTIAGENDTTAASKPALDDCEAEAARSWRNIPEPDARCDEAASKVFNELPEVKRALARMRADYAARLKTEPSIAMGGFGPQDNGDGSFTVAQGLHTNDRFEDVAMYRVDRATGRLEVAIPSEDDPHVAASDLRSVQAACKR
jgi:hypothetical protein